MFFNRYKFQKKINRGVHSASTFLFNKDENTNYKHDNHYFKPASKGWDRIKFIILLISVGAILGVLFYHPLFTIKDITISGTERIKSADLKETTLGVINYRNWGLIPKNNYFLVNLGEIDYVLKERYPILAITTKKEFPNKLSIIIQEKISQIIYDNGQKYFYLDTNGKVIETLKKVGDEEFQKISKINSTDTTSTPSTTVEITNIHVPQINDLRKEFGDYPVIYDKRLNLDLNQPFLTPEIVKSSIFWFNKLKQLGIGYNYLTLDDNLFEGLINTSKGWGIKIKFDNDQDYDSSKLQYILQNEKINLSSLKYIDLRFKNKIFWQ